MPVSSSVSACFAVLDVYDQIAFADLGGIGDKGVRLAFFAGRSHQPVAEQVLFGDDRELGRAKTALERHCRKNEQRWIGVQCFPPRLDKR